MKILLFLCLLVVGEGLSPSSNLSAQDKNKLKSVFSQNIVGENDMTSVYYSVLGLKLLGEPIKNSKDLCVAAAKLSDDSSVEILYAASGAAAALGCPITLGAKAVEAIKANTGEGSTTASIFFATKTLKSVGSKIDKAVGKALTNAIKKDDSLLSLGLAFNVAALLDGDVSAVFERIEDAMVQADEVDGRMLQFEGGLSVTSIVLTGASSLAAKVKKPLPLTGAQAVKFANYLISRKSVQQAKGGLHLLEGIESMTGSAQFTPVSVSLVSSLSVSAENPNLVLAVTDLKGNPVGDLKVTLDSATKTSDDSSLATNKVLTKSGNDYSLDLMALSPGAGFYEIVVSAVPAKSNPALVGNTGVKMSVKVLVKQNVVNAELKVGDGDQTKTTDLKFPATQKAKVNVDASQSVSLTFDVVDPAGKNILVHQAFVKVANKASKAEIIYVAEADRRTKMYKFDLDLRLEAAEFTESGDYSLTVILGDAVVSNPVSWHVADLALTVEKSEDKPAGLYQPKPEIKHLFREPETRPPQAVSSVFTLLVLSPVLLLLGLWIKLGANISNFSFSPAAIGFHVGLGAIFMLYVYFWMKLNMFEVMRYLALLGVFTFLAGNSLLASIAKKNK